MVLDHLFLLSHDRRPEFIHVEWFSTGKPLQSSPQGNFHDREAWTIHRCQPFSLRRPALTLHITSTANGTDKGVSREPSVMCEGWVFQLSWRGAKGECYKRTLETLKVPLWSRPYILWSRSWPLKLQKLSQSPFSCSFKIGKLSQLFWVSCPFWHSLLRFYVKYTYS